MENQINRSHSHWIRWVSVVSLALLNFILYTVPWSKLSAIVLIGLIAVATIVYVLIVRRQAGSHHRLFGVVLTALTLIALTPAVIAVSAWDDVQFTNNSNITYENTGGRPELVDRALALPCWGYTGGACFAPTLIADNFIPADNESIALRWSNFYGVSSSVPTTYIRITAFGGTFNYFNYELDLIDDPQDPVVYYSPAGKISKDECRATVKPTSTYLEIEVSNGDGYSSASQSRVVIFDAEGAPTCQIYTPIRRAIS